MDFLHFPSSLRSALLRQPSIARILRRDASTSISVHGSGSSSSSFTTPPLLTLSSATLNSYITTTSPANSSLRQANAFFTRHPPSLLFSTPYFRSFPPSPFPEVAFLGRSNVGKSSLLNALFGRPQEKPAHVSKRPGRTRTMNGFGVGGEGMTGAKKSRTNTLTEKAGGGNNVDATWKRLGAGGIVVVDMPGYGSGSRQEWGDEIMKYLSNRRQLRRTYVLIDTEHGLKKSDISLLVHLRQQGVAHQIILSKVDKLLFPGPKIPGSQSLHERLLRLESLRTEVRKTLNRAAGEVGGRDDVTGDILCCSAEKSVDERGRNKRIGVDEVRWSVLTACGLENDGVVMPKSETRKGDKPNDVGDVVPYVAFS